MKISNVAAYLLLYLYYVFYYLSCHCGELYRGRDTVRSFALCSCPLDGYAVHQNNKEKQAGSALIRR